MDMNTVFPSKYIAAADLQGQVQDVAIASVAIESADHGGEPFPVVYFTGVTKGMRLNKTNTKTIINLYGSESEGWKGKPLAIFPTECSYKGDIVPCIRVKSMAPTVNGSVQGDTLSTGQPEAQGAAQPASMFGGTA